MSYLAIIETVFVGIAALPELVYHPKQEVNVTKLCRHSALFLYH